MKIHEISLVVTQDCGVTKDMNNEEIKLWVEEHFVGCDYGSVEVDSVKSFNVRLSNSELTIEETEK